MKPPSQIPLSFLEILEDLHSCRNLGEFFQRFCHWGGQLCGAQGIGVALLGKSNGSRPHRVLFYTGGISIDPHFLSTLNAALPGNGALPACSQSVERGNALFCCFELIPGVDCVVKAGRAGDERFREEDVFHFRLLQRVSSSILRGSVLIHSLRFICQKLEQNHCTRIPDRLSPGLFGLTPRESEVLKWVEVGKQDGEIALILNMSCRTVQTHVRALLHKLDCENRLQLMTLRLSGVLDFESTDPPAAEDPMREGDCVTSRWR